MIQKYELGQRLLRPGALLLTTAMVLPPFLAGCGSGNQATSSAPPPPPGMSQPVNQPAVRSGMSTKQKVALLAGAAALYYLYRRHQKAQAAAGPQGKYFLSKNGRVYYRDLKTGAFQWVSPPTAQIQVPASEAQAYSGYAGYNGAATGQGFGGYGPGQPNYADGQPATSY